MRRTTQLFGVLGLVLLLAACSEPHFMTDTSYRRRVEQDFLQKQALMTQGGFFSIFNSDLPVYEREALEFLYAYMPLADITDYPGEFHLMNVRASRRAAGEMPWGRDIPEDVFRHFVLPVREQRASGQRACRLLRGIERPGEISFFAGCHFGSESLVP